MSKRQKGILVMSDEEIMQRQKALEVEIFSLRNELTMQHKSEKPHLLKAKRHELARVLTLLTQNRRKAQ